MIYDIIASIYDKINEEVNYKSWADFIEEANWRFGTIPVELILDLACGTGKMTLELAKRGFDMTGVDLSPEMLDIARTNAEKAGVGHRMLWLMQDMRSFELYGTVDLAVCCLDSINHLTNAKDVRKTFSLVHNYLMPDGLFFFDINGRKKFEKVYAQECYVYEEEHSFCIWQNDYNEKTHNCHFYITVFKEEDEENFSREDDCERERMYTIRQISSALADTGFELIGAYSDFQFTPATDDDMRIYFIAKCRK